MTDTITLTGLVATTPRHMVTPEGLRLTSFRLASDRRRPDQDQTAWTDGDTNWYTVTCRDELAANASASVEKGQRVLVSGQVRIRDWQTEGSQGTSIEVEADTLGHDLQYGTAKFTRPALTAARAHERGGSRAEPHENPTHDAAALNAER